MSISFRDRMLRPLPPSVRSLLNEQYRQLSALKNRLLRRGGSVRLHGVRLEADPARLGPEVVRQLLRGDYEGREARMARMFLEPDDVVMELGAGIGFIGLLCARRVGADRVHSFEANPAMEEIIRRNHRLNGMSPHLEIAALGAGEGEIVIHVPDIFWGASQSALPGARPVTTRRRDFRETVRELSPTFLMMDIEGGEVDIIHLLEPGSSIRKIAFERHPAITGEDAIVEMDRILEGLGFAKRWSSRSGQHAYFERPQDRAGRTTKSRASGARKARLASASPPGSERSSPALRTVPDVSVLAGASAAPTLSTALAVNGPGAGGRAP